MIKNKRQIINYLDNVIKHLPDDRDFTVFGQKKYNDYSSSRFVLIFLKFFYTVAENLLIYLHLWYAPSYLVIFPIKTKDF